MTTSTPSIRITPATHRISEEQRAERLASLSFGRTFTEHMVVIPYKDGAWQQGEVKPYGPLSLDPSASTLHYGQSIFEGFKAYVQPDGTIKTFRPEANAARFNRSAKRMAMPAIPAELFIQAADALINLDKVIL